MPMKVKVTISFTLESTGLEATHEEIGDAVLSEWGLDMPHVNSGAYIAVPVEVEENGSRLWPQYKYGKKFKIKVKEVE
jgi:hypothetical protein